MKDKKNERASARARARKQEGGGGEKEKYDESGITERERDNARHYSISVKYILTDSQRPSVEKVLRNMRERYCGITRNPPDETARRKRSRVIPRA